MVRPATLPRLEGILRGVGFPRTTNLRPQLAIAQADNRWNGQLNHAIRFGDFELDVTAGAGNFSELFNTDRRLRSQSANEWRLSTGASWSRAVVSRRAFGPAIAIRALLARLIALALPRSLKLKLPTAAITDAPVAWACPCCLMRNTPPTRRENA